MPVAIAQGAACACSAASSTATRSNVHAANTRAAAARRERNGQGLQSPLLSTQLCLSLLRSEYIHVTIWAETSANHSAVWQVLGRRHADGSSIFTVDRLVEGIVAFEDESMAEAFGHALEAEGHQVLFCASSGCATCKPVVATHKVNMYSAAVAQFATP